MTMLRGLQRARTLAALGALALMLGLGAAAISPAHDDALHRCGDFGLADAFVDDDGNPGTPDVVNPDDALIVIDEGETPTDGNDVVFGTDGADTIDARSGNDVVCGFDGGDTLRGDAGDDELNGGSGADRLDGGDGGDNLFGETGSDDLHGDAGDDHLFAGEDGDGADGGEGNDSIQGESGNDRLLGSAGDDTIAGDDDADTIEGGDGNDALSGLGGDDTIDAGTGNDEDVSGGAGNDTINGRDGGDPLSGGDGTDVVNGGAGDDTLGGGTGGDTMDGGEGNDTIAGDDGSDSIAGNSGEDNIAGGDQGDTLSGGDGADSVAGQAGNDTVRGNDGDDGLFGGAGDDGLDGGGGADAISGGEGTDTADYSGTAGAPIVVDLSTGEVAGGAGADVLAGVENVIGTPFDDELTGDATANALSGGAGEDTIDGAGGNDTESGGDGNDVFTQTGEVANGADVMHGGGGIDTVDYTERGNPVTSTNDGVANDGEAGEGDNVQPDVEGANIRPVLNPPPPPTPDLTSPALSGFSANVTRFSPNDDGRRDEFIVTGRFSESTQWTFEVLSGSSVVFSETGQGVTLRAVWTGLTGEARNAVSATYRWRVTGKDAAGNAIPPRTGTITVDRARPRVTEVRVRPRRFDVSRDRSTQIRFRAGEAGRFQVKIRRGSFLRTFGPREIEEPGTVSVTWNGRSSRGRVAKAGTYRVEIGVRDIAGNLRIRRSTIRLTP